VSDSSVVETGAADSPADAPADEGTGTADSGRDSEADGSVEAASDAHTDAPADGPTEVGTSEAGGGALVPCTASGQTNCVSCTNIAANNGVCTPTEAVFVQVDITAGVVTAAGPDSASSGCYQCIVGADCLDSTRVHVQECGDLAGNFTNGSGASVNAADTCVDALECMTTAAGAHCENNDNGISYCYCGPGGGAPTACAANGSAANGPCFTQEVAGFMFVGTDSSDILTNYTDTSEPSGQANTIIDCAQGNLCMQCLP
jgi:hypothetical protein